MLSFVKYIVSKYMYSKVVYNACVMKIDILVRAKL